MEQRKTRAEDKEGKQGLSSHGDGSGTRSPGTFSGFSREGTVGGAVMSAAGHGWRSAETRVARPSELVRNLVISLPIGNYFRIQWWIIDEIAS